MLSAAGLVVISSFALAAWLTPRLRDAALRRGLLDHALNSRKVHGPPVPRLGGVGIVLAFHVPVVSALLWPGIGRAIASDPSEPPGRVAALLAGGAAIAALGQVHPPDLRDRLAPLLDKDTPPAAREAARAALAAPGGCR